MPASKTTNTYLDNFDLSNVLSVNSDNTIYEIIKAEDLKKKLIQETSINKEKYYM